MTQTAATTLRALHGAAYHLASDNYPLSRAVDYTLAQAVGNADDTFAGQDDVCEEAWAEKALGSLETLLCYEPDATVREWFLAQGFTF